MVTPLTTFEHNGTVMGVPKTSILNRPSPTATNHISMALCTEILIWKMQLSLCRLPYTVMRSRPILLNILSEVKMWSTSSLLQIRNT